MPQIYTIEYQCFDCDKVYLKEADAAACCTDYLEWYCCPVCRKRYLVKADVEACCEMKTTREARGPITREEIARLIMYIPSSVKPKVDCEYCKVAQSVGRVVWCACIREQIENGSK